MGKLHNHRCRNCHSEASSATFGAGSGRGICFLLALTLACVAVPSRAAAYELGRLFFTPEQRQALDRRRATNRAEEEAPQVTEGPLILDGHIERSSGRTTTWINGVPQYDENPAGRDAAQVTVVPNPGEPGVSLKVGQTYERASGEVSGILNGGEITVGESPSKAQPAAGRGATGKSRTQTR
jgi:hypothetical protein